MKCARGPLRPLQLLLASVADHVRTGATDRARQRTPETEPRGGLAQDTVQHPVAACYRRDASSGWAAWGAARRQTPSRKTTRLALPSRLVHGACALCACALRACALACPRLHACACTRTPTCRASQLAT